MDNGVLKVALSTVIFEIGSLTAFNMDNDFRFNVTAPLFPLIRNNHRNVAPKPRGVWGCAPVDKGGRLAADSPHEKLANASFSCGDGRSRTAVRIKRQGAFYMLILPLLVGDRLPAGGPSVS